MGRPFHVRDRGTAADAGDVLHRANLPQAPRDRAAISGGTNRHGHPNVGVVAIARRIPAGPERLHPTGGVASPSDELESRSSSGPSYQFAMPAQRGGRREDQSTPGESPAEGRKDQTVGGLEFWALDLAAEDGDLVAESESSRSRSAPD